MPDGKAANRIAFLKFHNFLRTGDCEFNTDSIDTLQSFIASLKEMIGNDTRFAARTLRDFEAVQKNLPIVRPTGADLTYMIATGNQDGFTLKSTDSGTRAFLNIYCFFVDGPGKVMSQQVEKSLITVFLIVLQKVPYSGFEHALTACTGQNIDVCENDVVRCYHWAQAKGNNPCWNNGTPMTAAEVKDFLDMPVPY